MGMKVENWRVCDRPAKNSCCPLDPGVLAMLEIKIWLNHRSKCFGYIRYLISSAALSVPIGDNA